MKEKPTYEELERRVQELESIESKLKHFKKEVRESESLFKSLYEKAPLGYQSLDEDGRFIVVNHAWLDVLGYTQEEVIGKSFADFLPSEWRDHFKENFPQFKAIGEILGVEFEMVKKNGDHILVSFTGKIGRDEKGNFQQTHCIFSDITERKRAENELRTRESLFRTLVNTIPDLIWLKDADGAYLSCNKRFERFFGAGEADIVGKTDYDFVDKDLADFFRENDRKAMAAGGPISNEEQITIADDSHKAILETIKTPMFDADGKLIGVLGIGREITDRKRAEEALEKRLVALTQPLDNPEGISFEDLFVPADIQRLQDEFAQATGVASIITRPDGTPLTVPSNFCRLCSDLIRKTEMGLANCFKSDAAWGRPRQDGPTIQPCLSGGLWDAGAAISVGGHHVANWLIGQVRDAEQTEEKMRAYARKIGADETAVAEAFQEVPAMSYERFEKIARMLFTLANQLSATAYQNVQQARFITERKGAEEALRGSENQISSIFRSAPIGIGSVVNRMLTKVNKRLCEMTGYDETELVGQSARMLYLCDEDFEFVGREKYAQIADHGTGTVETRWRKQDGAAMDVLLSSTPVNLQDLSKGVTFTALDITERKRAEESLRERELTFRKLFEDSADAILLIDKTGVFVECNQAALTLLKMTREQFLFKPPVAISPEYQPDGQNSREKALKMIEIAYEKSLHRFDWTHINSEGIEFIVEVSLMPIKVKGELMLYTSWRDITERKRSEEALARQQRSIQLNNRIANVFLTSSPSEVFADVLDVIRTALDSRFGYFGYINEAGDLVSHSMTRDVWDQCQVTDKNIVFPRASWGGLWGRSLLEKQTVIANENLQVPEGHVILENALATPIVYNDNLIGQFVLANKAGGYDNDDRELLESAAAQTAPILFAIREEARQKNAHEKLEEQLRQSQKMEAVGRLAGGVAHDFNNMLGVIIGLADILLMKMAPDNPFHAHITEIRKAGERSADLTRQLLAFARKQTVAPKILDFNDTIESMLNLLRRLIGEDIDLLWKPGQCLWPVKMDPSQIDQILANLCVNARDAIVGVGKITIETDKASFDEEYCNQHLGFVPGDYVLLAVSDNGCGMDTETISHLFEPFFTTKELGKGTGLGLATVYGAVTQNNGFINVYSEPGQGTTFKIYLPRHATKGAVETKEPKPQAAERGSETILLVEDEPAILRMTTMMLEMLGYTVLAASTPGEALRLAQEHAGSIDLVLTDVVMPEMNGRDLAKNLLSIYPDMRRLFMSGYTANVIAHQGVLDVGVHFMQKPFSLENLKAKMREALEA